MGPMEQYFAARCLISAGDSTGTDMLVDLLNAKNDDVVAASRQLLAWLTGRSPPSSASDFILALQRNPLRARRPLPAPGIRL